MGFFDRLAGGRSKEAPKEEQPPQAPSEPAPVQELQTEAGPSYGPPKLDLQGLGAGGAVPGLAGMTPSSSGKLYDPYEGISAAVSVKKHAFRLPSQPEFVFEEEAAVRRRGWNENLQFYTGIGYLSGGVAGVGAGLHTYATVKPEFPLTSLKLQTNRLLNLAAANAKPFSNSAAILGLYFSSLESFITSQLEQYDLPEATNTVLAGACSGALFRSPRGPRAAAAAAVAGAVAGGSIAALRQIFPSL